MKKIAIYIDSEFHGTGGSQYTKAILNALISISKSNVSVTVIYTYNCWEDYLHTFPDVRVVFFKNNNLLNRLYQVLISFDCHRIAKQMAHQIDKKVAYIESQNFDFILFPISSTLTCLLNSKIIGTIHDLMHRYERRFKEAGGFVRYHYRENYIKHLLLSSPAIIVDSNFGKRQVLDSYKQIKSKIFALPYIAPDYIYSQEESQPSLSYDPLSSHKYVFYPAVFQPHKNHIALVKAIKILKERGHLIDLFLAGKRHLEFKKLLKFVDENDLGEQVKFLGHLPNTDIIYLYKNAFAMVMPTFFGPTNIPPIEAIVLNCPPIVSNIYGMPEQLGDAAMYFDPDNSSEIADIIESLLVNNELRNNLLRNGINSIEKFSQKRFESDLKNILENLFNTKCN
ncbi:MAG: glycosyltransferase family 4 protein [Bacteroidia bacterium]|nr:glycosyltransferase family 4 protein [Bacteroidia bacterium]